MCYSGYRKQQFLIDTHGNKCLIKSTESLYARLTKLSCWAEDSKEQKHKQDDDDYENSSNNNNGPVSSSSTSSSGGFKVFQVFDTPVRSYEPDEMRYVLRVLLAPTNQPSFFLVLLLRLVV